MKDWQVAISGGSQGIGKACAAALADGGVTNHLIGRRREPLEHVATRIKGHAYPADITDSAALAQVFEQIATRSNGRLDGLIINAARYGMKPLSDVEPAEFRAYLETNVIASLELVRLARPLLERGSGKSIVMVSSTLAWRPVPGTGVYAASKAALNSLTQCLALELAPLGIRVNAVLPGVVDTPIHEPQGGSDPTRTEKMRQLAPLHPLGRVGQATDVARLIEFLISPRSAWMTGARIPVDGGISIA